MDKTIYVAHNVSATGTPEAVYTCPDEKTFIGKVSIYNLGASDTTIETYVTIISTPMHIGKGKTTLSALSTVEVDYKEYEHITVPAYGVLYVKASAANAFVSVSGIEIDANIGIMESVTPGGTGVSVDVYTVPAGKVFAGQVSAYNLNTTGTNQVRSFIRDTVPDTYQYAWGRTTLPAATSLEYERVQSKGQMLKGGHTWAGRNELTSTTFVIMGIVKDEAT